MRRCRELTGRPYGEEQWSATLASGRAIVAVQEQSLISVDGVLGELLMVGCGWHRSERVMFRAEEESRMKILWRVALPLYVVLVVVAIGAGVWTYVQVEWFRVTDNAMAPTIPRGASVGVTSVPTYEDLERGDLIAFITPRGGILIRRVIGLQGDVVTWSAPDVTVNGLPCEEPYATFDPDSLLDRDRERHLSGETVVQEGLVFLMADDRSSMSDSRIHGPVSFSTIKGHAFKGPF